MEEIRLFLQVYVFFCVAYNMTDRQLVEELGSFSCYCSSYVVLVVLALPARQAGERNVASRPTVLRSPK
jgi:hypothetical protein